MLRSDFLKGAKDGKRYPIKWPIVENCVHGLSLRERSVRQL
jgi:hypothetical protein